MDVVVQSGENVNGWRCEQNYCLIGAGLCRR